jgi:hypothetical protein
LERDRVLTSSVGLWEGPLGVRRVWGYEGCVEVGCITPSTFSLVCCMLRVAVGEWWMEPFASSCSTPCALYVVFLVAQ